MLVFLCLYTLKNNAQSVGGIASGSQTYCDTINSGFVSISGYVGNVVTWQYSTNGGATWTSNGNTISSQSYFNLKQTTCYRAIVKSGAFPADTSTTACVTIYLPSVGGIILGGGTFCGGSGNGNLYLTGNTGSVLYWQSSINSGASWTNISNTSTTLSYSNITQNISYRIIVQNSAFCLKDTSSEVSFIINPLTVAGTINSVGTTTVCFANNSNTLNLSGNVGNVLNWVASENNGTSWLAIPNTTTTLTTSNLTQTTLFKAVVQSANCSIDSTNSVKIYVIAPITVNAGSDTTINQGQSVSLNGSGTGTPLWVPSNGLDNAGIFNPIASPAATIDYILTVTDINSCINSDTLTIKVLPSDFDGIITNVFSPNSDGINDNWYIENIRFYPNNEVTVYNIYGNIVFNQKAYNNDWQGTYNGAPLPDGTYFYVINFTDTNTLKKGSLDIFKNK
ncbi:MAG: gliding motility-associated C-terminal domain-containing protein [Bacteroidota bacterium]